MVSNKRQYRADLLLILVVAIWGSTFSIMKIILIDIDPYYFITLRFMVAFISLLLVFHNRLKYLTWSGLRKGFILGLWLLGGYAFQIVGLQYTTASRSGFITGLAVVLVPFLALVILKEVPGLMNWLGVLLAIAGLFLLTGTGGKAINYGDYLTLLCAVSFAMQIVLLSKYLKGEDPAVLTLVQMGVVAGGAFLITLFTSSFRPITVETAGVVVYTGLLATAFAFFIQSYAQQFTSPTHAGLIFTMEPIFGALFSFLILGELIGTGGIIGGLLIISGMLLAELKDRKKTALERKEAKSGN